MFDIANYLTTTFCASDNALPSFYTGRSFLVLRFEFFVTKKVFNEVFVIALFKNKAYGYIDRCFYMGDILLRFSFGVAVIYFKTRRGYVPVDPERPYLAVRVLKKPNCRQGYLISYQGGG